MEVQIGDVPLVIPCASKTSGNYFWEMYIILYIWAYLTYLIDNSSPEKDDVDDQGKKKDNKRPSTETDLNNEGSLRCEVKV